MRKSHYIANIYTYYNAMQCIFVAILSHLELSNRETMAVAVLFVGVVFGSTQMNKINTYFSNKIVSKFLFEMWLIQFYHIFVRGAFYSMT